MNYVGITIYGYITNSQSDQLPVGLIAQLRYRRSREFVPCSSL